MDCSTRGSSVLHYLLSLPSLPLLKLMSLELAVPSNHLMLGLRQGASPWAPSTALNLPNLSFAWQLGVVIIELNSILAHTSSRAPNVLRIKHAWPTPTGSAHIQPPPLPGHVNNLLYSSQQPVKWGTGAQVHRLGAEVQSLVKVLAQDLRAGAQQECRQAAPRAHASLLHLSAS